MGIVEGGREALLYNVLERCQFGQNYDILPASITDIKNASLEGAINTYDDDTNR